MKKAYVLFMVVLMLLLIASCSGLQNISTQPEEKVTPSETSQTMSDASGEAQIFLKDGTTVTLNIVEYTSGPSVSDAVISIDKNEDGTINITARKYGYAVSKVVGLKPKDGMTYSIVMKKAAINPDSNFEEAPSVEVAFYTDDTKSQKLDMSNITSDPYVVIKATGKHKINIIYAAAGKIPSASFFGDRLYASATDTVEGNLNVSGLSGETEIHVVVYDYNDNRVDYVFYGNVVKSGTTSLEKYGVIRCSDYYEYPNLEAYTRRSGIEFYSLPGDIIKKIGKEIKVNGKTLSKDFSPRPMAAPKDSNLWIDVCFVDYDSAVNDGLIDQAQVARPEAYAIYRSFDGVKWEKIGVTENGLYRDASSQLSAGKKVYYKVAAVYPDGEAEPTDLGYVVPLDVFNVELEGPADGETNVSRDPTFVWRPTNDAFSVVPSDINYDGFYVYTLWIYDLVQSENHLLPLTPGSTEVIIDDNYNITNQYIIVDKFGKESLRFSSVPWAIIAYDFGAVGLYPYTALEPNKTYEWAVDLAYAQAVFEGGNMAYSIAIDEGYGSDPFGALHGDIYNTFTTGQE